MPEVSTDNATGQPGTGKSRWLIAFWLAWVITLGLAVWNEWPRWFTSPEMPNGQALRWLSDPKVDWSPFVPVLLLAIPLWFFRRPLLDRTPRFWLVLNKWLDESCPMPDCPTPTAEHVRALLLSVVVAATGFAMSWHVGQQFGDLPPAYHDEYSYLFQAETFLAGRLSFPSFEPMPELFDQMHVLNEGRFASRYFPGAGLWMAPFLAMGNAWWGHWTAHAFASFLVFWIGRHLANNRVGLLAGLLMAVSPGVGLFSNLLLAHHPTLFGLLVFVITFLKMRMALRHGKRTRGWAFLAGTGLTYAMLCRPMTAAGIGLPFGVWFGWWILAGRSTLRRHESADEGGVPVPQRLLTALAMSVPLLVGLAGLFVFNKAITGDALVTPYQQYTDIYTPRHVYGFNNRIRGEAALGPKVLENYDKWAENLTPALAAKNVWRRSVHSTRWTLGVVPLLMTTIMFLLTIDRWSSDWWLIAAAIISLHVVHIPYWFEGIMSWHYVFESAPFWLLLFAGTLDQLRPAWLSTERPWMPVWGSLLVIVSAIVNLVTVVPLWPSRIDTGVAEVAFSRQHYAAFNKMIKQRVDDGRALILVEADPSDRHMDYVVNDPALQNQILFGRYRPGTTETDKVAESFPDRDIWYVDVATYEVRLVAKGQQ
ncbi:MAG: hypothetical protein KDA93_14520 [Planctomycetaceae bacterium]|nr:hypothetical protein [Planctomycetaceae bacterium]